MEGADKDTFELRYIDIHGPTLLVKFQGCQHFQVAYMFPLLVLILWLIVLFTVPGQAPLSE